MIAMTANKFIYIVVIDRTIFEIEKKKFMFYSCGNLKSRLAITVLLLKIFIKVKQCSILHTDNAYINLSLGR